MPSPEAVCVGKQGRALLSVYISALPYPYIKGIHILTWNKSAMHGRPRVKDKKLDPDRVKAAEQKVNSA